LAAIFALTKVGINIATNIAMIAITASNSTKVKRSETADRIGLLFPSSSMRVNTAIVPNRRSSPQRLRDFARGEIGVRTN
jgi:hypothetical protein